MNYEQVETKRQIAILGSTGSIGRQTLDIMAEYPELFSPYLLTANTQAELLAEQAVKYGAKHVIIADNSKYEALKAMLSGHDIIVEAGADAISNAMNIPAIDTVVTAMVGYSGLEPTINAIKNNKTIALANKETLVVAGELIYKLLEQSSSRIYPVDSEHGAIFQCLVGEDHDSIEKIILTASGGPFRTKSIEELQYVTKADALKHPNWSMGAKITIDSATMMNKGFEVLEARWLFDMRPDQIEVVVHPQSIIHSMVEFKDSSVKAQLGLPDMHLPIRYALGFPKRLESKCERMKVTDYANLTFEEPDYNKFPLLGMAFEAMKKAGNVPCVLNAANEIAVAAFLKEQIRFVEIPQIIQKTMDRISFIEHPSYTDYVNTNADAREYAASLIK
ncbi:MAG: 1-deoxy-D-xylulose-5-phosphate reductoisomerase [Muribaculaceae bacterium]|nr:1-deoxy-D-xylulose-5-phosphate reductoisomerase [Muribaculaceae bacterium]